MAERPQPYWSGPDGQDDQFALADDHPPLEVGEPDSPPTAPGDLNAPQASSDPFQIPRWLTSEGRDGSSAVAAVAALATHVNRLRQDLKSLATP